MADPAEPLFKVTKQDLVTEPDHEGNIRTHWKVHFRTRSGTHAHVTIPDSHYSADQVAMLAHHKATEIEQVHAINQGGIQSGM